MTFKKLSILFYLYLIFLLFDNYCQLLLEFANPINGIDLIFLFLRIADKIPTVTLSPEVKIKSFSKYFHLNLLSM